MLTVSKSAASAVLFAPWILWAASKLLTTASVSREQEPVYICKFAQFYKHALCIHECRLARTNMITVRNFTNIYRVAQSVQHEFRTFLLTFAHTHTHTHTHTSVQNQTHKLS
jgi:hypothetical protein